MKKVKLTKQQKKDLYKFHYHDAEGIFDKLLSENKITDCKVACNMVRDKVIEDLKYNITKKLKSDVKINMIHDVWTEGDCDGWHYLESLSFYKVMYDDKMMAMFSIWSNPIDSQIRIGDSCIFVPCENHSKVKKSYIKFGIIEYEDDFLKDIKKSIKKERFGFIEYEMNKRSHFFNVRKSLLCSSLKCRDKPKILFHTKILNNIRDYKRKIKETKRNIKNDEIMLKIIIDSI